MQTSPVDLAEQRRIVTALFADIVGSTTLAERFDPEEVREVLGGTIALVIEQVDALGGTVKDLAGDGVLALFGAPTAHEDDAERAITCGLRIVDAISERAAFVARKWGVEGFAVRVGIETGWAVTGPVGGGSHVEYGATGDALNTAARLMAVAEPGSVMVGATTREMVEDRFTWSAEQAYGLKGKERPVLASRVSGYAPRQGAGPRAVTTPLVGRAKELRCIDMTLARLRGGRGSVLVLIGDAGVGKSRLVSEMRQRFTAFSGRPWLEAGAVSYAGSVPYFVYRSLLLGWLDLEWEPVPDRVRAAVELRAGHLGKEAAEHLRTVTPILTGTTVEEADPETRQTRIFRAVVGIIDALAVEGPLVIALEDLHWSDPTSLALTEAVVALVQNRPLLMVLTMRRGSMPNAALRRLTDVAGGRANRLDIGPMADEAALQLAQTLLGGTVLPRALEDRLLETTGGNPFFVKEQVRALLASGGLERSGSIARFSAGSELALAPTVERALIARIDGLTTSRRQTLSAASVLGARFTPALISALTDTDSRRSIHQLERAGFFDLIPNGDREPETYRFRHALLQEAAYSNLLIRQRRSFHARAAEVLKVEYTGRVEQMAATLARHLELSGQVDRAVAYLALAARNAAADFANEEAAALASHGLSLLDGSGGPFTDERLPITVDLLRIKGAALRLLARYDEALRANRRILELLHAQDVVERAQTLVDIARILTDAHRYAEALAELDTAKSLIGDPPDTEAAFDVWIGVLVATSWAFYWLADNEQLSQMLRTAEPVVAHRATTRQRIDFYVAVRHAILRRDRGVLSDELMEIDELLYEAWRSSDDEATRADADFTRGFTLMWRRELDRAEPLIRASLVTAERLGSVGRRSRALTYLMVIARFRGNVEDAKNLLKPVKQAAQTADLPEYEAMAMATAAWIAYRRADEDTVHQEGTRALEIWAALPNRYPTYWMCCLPLLAVAVAHGQLEEGCRLAALMLDALQQPLPPEVDSALRAALKDASAGRSEQLFLHLQQSVVRARSSGYL